MRFFCCLIIASLLCFEVSSAETNFSKAKILIIDKVTGKANVVIVVIGGESQINSGVSQTLSIKLKSCSEALIDKVKTYVANVDVIDSRNVVFSGNFYSEFLSKGYVNNNVYGFNLESCSN